MFLRSYNSIYPDIKQ